ncbi:glycosyl hydrolase [Streptomyces endophyticus]|uniref:Glycosyl hydrolase n=1 Tax=Streptomyces endophyticus TaxID=714166 RepID=A0ABU6F9T9_9ACTN|nr:glycosyl hydrolase [Streptomyces endophyticus]MEB8339552.1 glycosyl hydrolase [Streptomyces endophyticus]
MRRRDILRGTVALGASALALRATSEAAALSTESVPGSGGGLDWPRFAREARPWTRWWWLGSAVTEAGLARHLEQFQQVGFGGVEIQPIYEAQGYEDHDLAYLGQGWLAALDATTRHARRLDLGVDLTTGSGWTFGGPWVKPEQSAGKVLVEHWELGHGERLGVPVRTTQPPHPGLVDEEKLARPDLRPPMDPLPEPPLAALVAREADSGDTVDLTARVHPDGTLDWTAPAGSWQLTGVFSGLVLKRVERAGPGGKGLMVDYFDGAAVRHHLDHFGEAIGSGRGIRALFHDSFELEATDWTHRTVAEFARLRGYDLVPHLPEVFTDAGTPEVRSRVLSDVRETLADLFLEQFAEPWDAWSAERGWLTRNQAHGSPANLLDIYGAADIPETEYAGAELIPIPGLRQGAGTANAPKSLVWRFASSPAHVLGKPLASAETLTWRDEHFHVALSQAKPTVDLLFAAGINHLVFHGTAYSPAETEGTEATEAAEESEQSEESRDIPWPGFSFYAAAELQPANTLWGDLPELNDYITRCQSVLQSGEHGNDVLVHFPQHDLWALPDGGVGDGAEDIELSPDYKWEGTDWMYGHPSGVGDIVAGLEARGWQFDWVSDRQLADFRGSADGVSNGHSRYAVVLVPNARLIPLETARRLRDLAAAGATVVFVGGLPEDVPGLAELDRRRAEFKQIVDELCERHDPSHRGRFRVGRGHVVVTGRGGGLDTALAAAGAVREPVADSGLRVLRRRHTEGNHLFLTNVTAQRIDGWWPLGSHAASVGVLDPLHDTRGLAETRRDRAAVEVRLRLEPGESRILRTFTTRALSAAPAPAPVPTGRERELTGPWTLAFRKGGPELPPTRTLDKLVSWTELGGQETEFSGSARYTLRFTATDSERARDWLLDLGDVRESARVRLNGRDVATAWALPFRVPLGRALREGENVLELDVTNLAANRVRALARRGELALHHYMQWRSAPPQDWDPMPSGLLGPVRLVEVGR